MSPSHFLTSAGRVEGVSGSTAVAMSVEADDEGRSSVRRHDLLHPQGQNRPDRDRCEQNIVAPLHDNAKIPPAATVYPCVRLQDGITRRYELRRAVLGIEDSAHVILSAWRACLSARRLETSSSQVIWPGSLGNMEPPASACFLRSGRDITA